MPEAHLLLRDGTPLSLTPKAFETLVILVRNSGRLVRKEDLMGQIWPDTFVEETSLTRNISVLRKLLTEGEGTAEYIETVTRLGYRFNAPVRLVGGTEAEELVLRHTRTKIVTEEEIEDTPEDVAITSLPKAHLRRRAASRIAAGIALAGTVLFAGFNLPALRSGWQQIRAGTWLGGRPQVLSVAVLAFDNRTGDPAQEYLADGLTDLLITDLAKAGSLRVISRASSVHYKETKRPMPEIARELGVDGIVEGSVVRSGEGLRITVRLLHGPSDRSLWAETFAADTAGINQVEAEIARNLIEALRIPAAAGTARAGPRTADPRAFHTYVAGRYQWNLRTPEGYNAALGLYQEAIQLDPRFALAYAGMADTYIVLGSHGFIPPHEARVKAKAAASKALELDPTLAEALYALASVQAQYEMDVPGAEQSFLRAIERNPNYATGRQWHATNLAAQGRLDEALREIQMARQLDPLSLRIQTDGARILYFARQYDAAITECRKVLETDAKFSQARFLLGLVYVQKAWYDQAITELEAAAGDVPSGWLGYAYARAGRLKDARRILDRRISAYLGKGTGNGMIALIWLGLGDKEKAFRWIEFNLSDPVLFLLKADPYWDLLRSDPRFSRLLQRMNLPADASSINPPPTKEPPVRGPRNASRE
ncbi:MAG: winged helix-turn-helix domain-containing protein [Acidobacteria bacterium]|nr:winged helix-turn-helix domain-containing protein [Acidobacteriota bacterium]